MFERNKNLTKVKHVFIEYTQSIAFSLSITPLLTFQGMLAIPSIKKNTGFCSAHKALFP